MSVNLEQSSPKTIHSLPNFTGTEMRFGPENERHGMGRRSIRTFVKPHPPAGHQLWVMCCAQSKHMQRDKSLTLFKGKTLPFY
ncbi:hypothetical protein PRUPE_3G267700 [Prunus persica]|uniref:Uncharacterized protein n=1 Tax=Prunus persica TaxID=3760 RepID=M5X4G0_PRUPE|nr:hypothetical protein PRUPE_3G267700 [Prunus persica]